MQEANRNEVLKNVWETLTESDKAVPEIHSLNNV